MFDNSIKFNNNNKNVYTNISHKLKVSERQRRGKVPPFNYNCQFMVLFLVNVNLACLVPCLLC